jgi:predicted kinase
MGNSQAAKKTGGQVPELTVLVGLPGSGKSTWAKRNLPQHVYISPDEIRYEKFEVQFDQKVEPQVWQIALALVEGNLKLNRPVVFDATNLTPKRREFLVEIGQRHGAFLRAVLVNTPLSRCLKQNRTRRSFEHVPDRLIINMAKTLVKPKKEEGFDEVLVVKPEGLAASLANTYLKY